MAQKNPPPDRGAGVEVVVAAAPAVVWPALRDPDLIRRWHGWDYDGLAEEIRKIYVDGAVADDARHTLALDGGDRFTLSEHEGTTIVRITRAPRGTNPDHDDYYEDITEGWTTFLQFLAFGIERHGLDERRTIYLEGPVAQGDSARSLLGLDALEGMAVGDRFSVTADPGDLLQGVVCFVGAHQSAISIDDLGPGLLSMCELPITAQRPRGGAQILLATYNVSDEEFDELEARWNEWWRERAPSLP